MGAELSTHIKSVPQQFKLPVEQPSFDDQGPRSEIDLRALVKVLYKYRALVAITTLVAAVLSIAYISMVTPQYTAKTTIKISTYEPILSATKIEDVLAAKSREGDYLETQLSEIKSFSLADQVLSNSGIVEELFPADESDGGSWWFFSSKQPAKVVNVDQISGYRYPLDKLEGYLSKIQISPIRRTSLAVIEATTSKPTLSAKIANTHAQQYIEWVKRQRIENQSQGLKFLRQQSEELKEKVADLEREIADYAESHSIVAVNKDENITAQRMAQLNGMLTEATTARIEAENIYLEAEKTLESNSAGFDDSSVLTLREKLGSLEAEYGNLSMKFTPNYPKMQQLKAQIQNAKQGIAAQRKQVVTGLKAKWQASLEKEKMLKEELERQKSRTFELSKSQVQYNILNRELASSRELLESILRQIKETSLSVESNASNVSVVDYATVPRSPSYPRKKLFVSVSLMLGLGLGLGLAFLLSYLDNTIRTPEELTQLTALPSLGVVPSFLRNPQPDTIKLETALADPPKMKHEETLLLSDTESSAESQQTDRAKTTVEKKVAGLPIIYIDNPQSIAAESYRTIRTGILLSQAGDPPKTMLISSAQSSEGKTTSASNLAATLASSGARVILIDADLRRPSVYRYFNIDRNAPGLVDILTNQRSFEEVAITGKMKRVSIIPSGQIPPNPAELLGSIEMASFIERMSQEFDFVLIDSPPVLPVTDSVILSRYVDGVVLVVKAGSTPRKVVQDATQKLRGVGAKMLGAILNDVDVTRGDYYYYNRYYSLYYQESQDRETPA